jgi:cyanophycinase
MTSFRTLPGRLALLLCATLTVSLVNASTDARGCAIAIGGALKPDNGEVWRRVVESAGGPGARFVVFASAAENPERSAAAIMKSLQQFGAVAEHIPVAVKLKSPDWREAVRDPALIAKVKASRGAYFAGGAQARITEVLLSDEGREMLAAIRDVQQRGGVIAGSSAGAAIMSATMFVDPQPVLDMLKFGVQSGKNAQDLGKGLGFAGDGLIVDQHFLKRGRFGRLLPALMHAGLKLGVGVDEDSAARFCGDEVEVFGAKGALVIDVSQATRDASIREFNVKNARLTYLDRGDRFNLKTRVVTPSAEKQGDRRIDPHAAGFKPYFTHSLFQTDILGDTTVVAVMSHVLDGKQREVIGLAFDAVALNDLTVPAARKPALGFEFRFSRTADSLGWFTSRFGGEDYTIANIRVDVAPVTLSRPLYRRRGDQ